MAARKKKKRSQAVRDVDRRLIPAWIWMTLGVVMGLGLALFLSLAGIMPGKDAEVPRPRAVTPPPSEELAKGEDWKPDYDFYTILPEQEVVVPDRATRPEAEPEPSGPYVLQVGSFKAGPDAEKIKAELAFLGLVAHIKEVEINRATWHRVRLGPYESRRQADQVKRQLQDQKYDVMMLSEKS